MPGVVRSHDRLDAIDDEDSIDQAFDQLAVVGK